MKEEYLETIKLDDVEYVRKDLVKNEIINFTGDKTIASIMIGKSAIIRSANEGVNIGIVELADNTGVVLKNCRRLYYHRPKDSSISWYEGVAMSGISANSKVSGTVYRKVIIEDYSMTECSKEVYESILNHKPNVQS